MNGPQDERPETALTDLLSRHSSFWCRAPVNEPILSVRPGPAAWSPRPWPIAGDGWAEEPRRIRPADVDLDRMVGFHSGKPELLRGSDGLVHRDFINRRTDLLNTVAPVYPQAWMGALIGCPIYVSAYGCVARPTGEDLNTVMRRFSVEAALDSPWLSVMDSMLTRATQIADGRYPVEQLHMRGVVDMLAALFGEAELCILLVDEPDAVRKLADRFAELLIAVAQRGLEIRSAWRGGYLHRWGIFAPGTMHDYQADASTILSPQLYEATLLDSDHKVLAAFEYSLIHLHAAGLHIVDPLLQIPELDAIQINLDRETGVWQKERILAVSASIQDAGKGLLLCGELTEREFDEFRSNLRSPGLALDCQIIPEG